MTKPPSFFSLMSGLFYDDPKTGLRQIEGLEVEGTRLRIEAPKPVRVGPALKIDQDQILLLHEITGQKTRVLGPLTVTMEDNKQILRHAPEQAKPTCPIVNGAVMHVFTATQRRCLCGEKEVP